MSHGYRQTARAQEDAIEAARQRGLAMQRANYAHGAIPGPQPVTTPIRHVSPALLGTPAQRDAFADRALAQERANHASAQSDEIRSEGRCHVNTRTDRNGP